MLSTAVHSVPWPYITPLLGLVVLSHLLIFYLFPLDAWYRTFAEWKFFDVQKSNTLNEYLRDSQKVVKDGLSKVTCPAITFSAIVFRLTVQANVFPILSDNGYKTILSPKFANEVARLPTLSFNKMLSIDFHAHIAGFSPFAQFEKGATIFQDGVRMKLTQALGRLTHP